MAMIAAALTSMTLSILGTAAILTGVLEAGALEVDVLEQTQRTVVQGGSAELGILSRPSVFTSGPMA